jgi:hypothetical protein
MSSPRIRAFTGLRSQAKAALRFVCPARGWALRLRTGWNSRPLGRTRGVRAPWDAVAGEGRNCGGIPKCPGVSPLTRGLLAVATTVTPRRASQAVGAEGLCPVPPDRAWPGEAAAPPRRPIARSAGSRSKGSVAWEEIGLLRRAGAGLREFYPAALGGVRRPGQRRHDGGTPRGTCSSRVQPAQATRPRPTSRLSGQPKRPPGDVRRRGTHRS